MSTAMTEKAVLPPLPSVVSDVVSVEQQQQQRHEEEESKVPTEGDWSVPDIQVVQVVATATEPGLA